MNHVFEHTGAASWETIVLALKWESTWSSVSQSQDLWERGKLEGKVGPIP